MFNMFGWVFRLTGANWRSSSKCCKGQGGGNGCKLHVDQFVGLTGLGQYAAGSATIERKYRCYRALYIITADVKKQ